MSRDLDSLADILDAVQRIIVYTDDMDKAAFQVDTKTQDAVIRCLEIIGEATKRLSPELRARHQQIPWQMMAGMRYVLIHAYDKINADLVWETAKESVPVLGQLLEPVISELSDQDTE